MLLSKAVDECGKNGECINDRLSNVEKYIGVSGAFSIKDGKLNRELYFKEIKDGEFIVYGNSISE
jgi:hypothetical protein